MASPRGSRVERFTIARGAVGKLDPTLKVFLGSVVAWAMIVFGVFPALHVLSRHMALAFPLGLFAMVGTLLVYMNLSGHLDLGADGVLIDWRGETRYIALADIDDAPPYSERVMGKTIIGVLLVLRSGDVVKVAIGEDQFGADRKVAALSERLRAAIAEHRRRESGEDASMLVRGDRSIEAWRERLRGLGEGANAGPREAPVPVDRLWRIVEDPGAAPPVRAGAAVALGRGLDEAGKQRLRVAADATAAPRLRIALEAAAAGDDDAVTAALSEVDEDGADASARV